MSYFLCFKGFGQVISIQAKVEGQTWSDDLLYDGSENYKQLSLMIKTKVRSLSEMHSGNLPFQTIMITLKIALI